MRPSVTCYSISDDQHDDAHVAEEEREQTAHVVADAGREPAPAPRHGSPRIARPRPLASVAAHWGGFMASRRLE